MTAHEWKRKRALRRFAEATKDVKMSRESKMSALEDVLQANDAEAIKAIREAFVKRPFTAEGEENDIRWLFANLLRACGVPARHV